MHFDRDVFKYPAVEYIPLYPYTLALQREWPGGSPEQVSLYVFRDQESLQSELSSLGITFAGEVNFGNYLVILTLGYPITHAYYRGHTVILLGNPLPGGYHIARIPRRYFYKDRIHFALYGGKAEKLAWANIVL